MTSVIDEHKRKSLFFLFSFFFFFGKKKQISFKNKSQHHPAGTEHLISFKEAASLLVLC